MNLNELIMSVKLQSDEEDMTNAEAIGWLNEGLNDLAIAVGGSFPQFSLIEDPSTQIPSLPQKYLHILKIYAVAKFKEYDDDYRAANGYNSQYLALKTEFVTNYILPPYYRDDHLSEQFVAVDGQTTFTVTKELYSRTQGDVKVYKNGIRIKNFSTDEENIILPTPCVVGDRISVVWEIHTDAVEPPYSWWKAW